MDKITWDPSFSVGVEILDKQHRQVIDVINLLIMNQNEDVQSETISEVLTKLTKYPQEHFRTEEELMAKHGYSGLAVQRMEHSAFRKKIADLCVNAMEHQQKVPENLLLFIRNW